MNSHHFGVFQNPSLSVGVHPPRNDSSSSPRAHFGKAVLSAQRGDYQTALTSFREAQHQNVPSLCKKNKSQTLTFWNGLLSMMWYHFHPSLKKQIIEGSLEV